MNLFDVYLEDESLSPGGGRHPFGAGHRRIMVVRRGPKWSALIDIDTAETAEMHTDTFERCKPVELLMPNYQELAVRLRRLSGEYGNNSAIYRDAMEALGHPVPKPEKTEAETVAAGEKVKRMHAAKAQKVVVIGTGEVPGQNEGSGLFIRRLWMTGSYTPERIVELVLLSYPGRTTKKSDVYWNYKKLLELGTPDVPPWPEREKPIKKLEGTSSDIKKEMGLKKKNPLKVVAVGKGKPDEPAPYDVKAMADATMLGRKQSKGKVPKPTKKPKK